jgi:hypothetical protein
LPESYSKAGLRFCEALLNKPEGGKKKNHRFLIHRSPKEKSLKKLLHNEKSTRSRRSFLMLAMLKAKRPERIFPHFRIKEEALCATISMAFYFQNTGCEAKLTK